MPEPEPPPVETEEPPPILGRWRTVYVTLLVELAVLIALFQALTWWAS